MVRKKVLSVPVTMPDKLNLSDALFIPPEADKYVETVLSYWDYAFAMADKEAIYAPPYHAPNVEQAEEILRLQYPQVAAAVDRVIIARSLARDRVHDRN